MVVKGKGKGVPDPPPGPALHACLLHWPYCTAFYAAKAVVSGKMLRYAVIYCALRRYDCTRKGLGRGGCVLGGQCALGCYQLC